MNVARLMLLCICRDVSEFELSFQFACPKFLSPVPPNYDNPTVAYHKLPFVQQQKVFMEEVMEQQLIPTIRSYLKLYTTLPISKLATLMDLVRVEISKYFPYVTFFLPSIRFRMKTA